MPPRKAAPALLAALAAAAHGKKQNRGERGKKGGGEFHSHQSLPPYT